jgi:hypothetical protein
MSKGCEWNKKKFSVAMNGGRKEETCPECGRSASVFYNIKGKKQCTDCYHGVKKE